MDRFPFDHLVNVSEKKVWVRCDSAITAMGICSAINKYYPGYTGHIASDDYFETLKQRKQL